MISSQYHDFKQSYLSSGRWYDRIDYTAVLTITYRIHTVNYPTSQNHEIMGKIHGLAFAFFSNLAIHKMCSNQQPIIFLMITIMRRTHWCTKIYYSMCSFGFSLFLSVCVQVQQQLFRRLNDLLQVDLPLLPLADLITQVSL